MKTKLKSIISVFLCIMLLASVCSAASIDSFETSEDGYKQLIIKGTPDGIVKGQGIRIEVLREDLVEDHIPELLTEDVDLKDTFIFIKQIPANEDGGYDVVVNMTGNDSGFYTIRVNGGEDIEKYAAFDIDKDGLIGDIKDICTKGSEETEDQAKVRATSELADLFEFDNDINTGRGASDTELFFDVNEVNNPVVYDVTDTELTKRFYSISSDLTSDNIREKLNEAAYIAALEENKIDIIKYKDELGLDEKYITAYENNITDENKQTFVSEYYQNKGYETKESVQDAFKMAVLDSWCSYFKGYADVEEYIKGFGEVVGVDMEDFAALDKNDKPELYKYLADKEGFSSTEFFVKAANDKMKELLDDEGGSGGGSLGGSGGGSAGGSGAIGGGTIVTPGIKPIENVPTKPENGSTFNDIADFEWAKEAIEALSEKGIVSGTGNGKYEPERNVTREEMLVMILRAFGIEVGEEVSDFTDAAADGWYNAYLAAAKKANFVSGKPDGSFGVGEAVTREDAAVMAFNIAKAKGTAFNTEKGEVFADDVDVADYANEAVYALKNAEVINGKGEGMFAPKANCTRAEAAKIIYTLIK